MLFQSIARKGRGHALVMMGVAALRIAVVMHSNKKGCILDRVAGCVFPMRCVSKKTRKD